MTERTFSILKPDATERNLTGKINALIEGAGLRIVAQRRIHLSKAQAEKFYEIHKERSFYGELVDFMSSGPIVAAVLRKENAVEDFRTLIGATDPSKAALGTIRALFAKNIGENAVHGADSDENALREASFHFAQTEIFR